MGAWSGSRWGSLREHGATKKVNYNTSSLLGQTEHHKLMISNIVSIRGWIFPFTSESVMHGINLNLTFFKTSADKTHSTETPFSLWGFGDNFSKSSRLCLTASVMAPLSLEGPFNLVTSQAANECFIGVHDGLVLHFRVFYIYGASTNVLISTFVFTVGYGSQISSLLFSLYFKDML